FDTWLDDLQLNLLRDIKDGVSLFDHVSGTVTAPPPTADSATRSQWLSRDAAARLAIRNHLPIAECAHFEQHRTAQALYDAVVARYSSPATATLGRLLLPYLFPELSAFATVEDLVSHLCASDARYRAAIPAEDHFLSLDPTSLTVDLLEQHLLAVETSAVAVGAARGTPPPPFFEGCSPSPFAPFYASAAATYVSVVLDVGAASACAKRRSSKGKGGKGGGGGSGDGGGGSGSSGGGITGGGGSGGTGGGSGGSGGGSGGSGGSGGNGGGGTGGGGIGAQRVGYGGGQRQQQQHRSETQSPQQLRVCVRSGSRLLLVSPPVAPDSSEAPLSGSPLPATPLWHALSSSCLWSSQVPTSPAALACPALPCVEGRQRAAPHSSSFPPTTAPLQTLHMDVWGPARVTGQDRERYFLLVVDDYTRYTTVFPLRSKGRVVVVLIPWIPTVRLQLRERFGQDLPVLRLHSDRGGEFSSNLLRDFCHGEGILQSFTLPDSPQQNGIAERRIGLVMEVALTSMIYAAAPHFLWPFACPAPSGVSQVDLLPGPAPVQVAVSSRAARGAASGGAASVGAEPGGVKSEGAETGVAELEGVEPGGAALEGAESGGAEPQGIALSGGSASASPRLSSQQLREWFVWRARLRRGATRAGGAGATGAGGAGAATGAGVTGGPAATGPGGAHTRGIGAAGTGGVDGAGAGDPTESGATGAGGSGGAGVGGTGTGGAGAAGPGAVDPGGAPDSSLPTPSPYTEPSGGLTERREPASRPVSSVRPARGVPRSRPPLVLGTHDMTLRPSCVPLRVPLLAPPESSLPEVPDPESDRARATSPIVSPLLASAVTDPSFDFAAACRLEYATALVAKSASAIPPSVGDSDAPDIPTPRSYAEAITVDGMWIFRVKRPSGSPPALKARYVARGFSQRQGVDYFQTFSPTSKITTLRVLLHVAAQRDYELHSLDFSTAFLQGSLHEEIWLCRLPGFTGSFPAGTQWSLWRPVYDLRQATREWHDTLRTTLAALGFAPSTADPSLFLRTDTSLPPFYVLVFATADTEALTLMKSELQKRHTCTDLGELRSYLSLQINQD
ncbi:unnamed protein product, partial [Closterium sp. NIES-54]